MPSKREKMTFRRKKVIFNQGDAANCMYRVDYGTVEIYLDYQKPGEKLIARLNEDQFFGELALIEDAGRSATAVAATDNTRLEVFPKDCLPEMLSEDFASFRKLLAQMSEKLIHLTDNYLDVCRTIAAYEAANDAGTSVDAGVQADIDKYADLFKEN